MHSIEARSLSKYFGEVKAVDDVTFAVETGEIFGFLGPNGAGKSTMMMMLTTLLKPASGQALVAGFDVSKNPKQVRQRIGYVQQDTVVDEYLTGRENMMLQARLSHIEKSRVGRRIDEILEMIELVHKQDDPVLTYSGGMRKRLDIAGGLLHRPDVLFLDEPTVGLDIQTRKKIWEYIRKIHNEFSMSIFLTTHYMEEADSLCDRIGIIDYGKIQVIDTPQKMKDAMGTEIIELGLEPRPDGLLSRLEEIPQVARVAQDADRLVLFVSDAPKVMPVIFQIISQSGSRINHVNMTQPTMDDVFMSYTGYGLRDDQSAGPRGKAQERT